MKPRHPEEIQAEINASIVWKVRAAMVELDGSLTKASAKVGVSRITAWRAFKAVRAVEDAEAAKHGYV